MTQITPTSIVLWAAVVIAVIGSTVLASLVTALIPNRTAKRQIGAAQVAAEEQTKAAQVAAERQIEAAQAAAKRQIEAAQATADRQAAAAQALAERQAEAAQDAMRMQLEHQRRQEAQARLYPVQLKLYRKAQELLERLSREGGPAPVDHQSEYEELAARVATLATEEISDWFQVAWSRTKAFRRAEARLWSGVSQAPKSNDPVSVAAVTAARTELIKQRSEIRQNEGNYAGHARYVFRELCRRDLRQDLEAAPFPRPDELEEWDRR